MNRPETSTYVRTAVAVLAIINQLLTAFGINPLPIDDEQVATVITVIVMVIVWWKNNSFTQHAVKADRIKKQLKQKEG